MCAARKGHLECVKILAQLEKGMQDLMGDTALRCAIYNLSDKECTYFLWQFPEEREKNGFVMVKIADEIKRISCEEGTCIGAGSLLNAAFIGCPQCAQKYIGEAGKQD